MTALLCGDEDLLLRFGLSVLEPLASSTIVSISVDALPREATSADIQARYSACGVDTPLVTRNVLEIIHQALAGNMRAIGTIATSALWKAYPAKSAEVEAGHIQAFIQR